jgi:hypothetical protein
LPAALHDSYVHSFTDSISTVFLIAAAVVSVAFLLALLLEERPLRKTIEDWESEAPELDAMIARLSGELSRGDQPAAAAP